MPKIDSTHKNYLTAEILEETHLRAIFYGTLIFQQSSIVVCPLTMLEGILLPSNMAANTNQTALLKNQSALKYLP